MKLKEQYTWMKHWDFILTDMLCLAFSYYLKFDAINFFDKYEWVCLFIVVLCNNFSITILESTYSGILRRRYYQQISREIVLLISQVAMLCTAFYMLKIGTFFSREMVFTAYSIYFIVAQPLKYARKKDLTRQIESREKIVEEIIEDAENMDIALYDKRSDFSKTLNLFLKRCMDIAGAIVGCIILVPLIGLVFVLNKLHDDDDGPIFYTQERIGKDGKKFTMFKFRSMVVDADQKLKEFLEENEDIRHEFEINRKIKNDPRITSAGAFLRKTSLDEFPQFINVLKGDMSLVGPRAVVDGEIEKFGKYQKYVLSVKPGITGNWAANGRSDTTYEERVMLECQYVNKFSVWNDIKLLFKTVISVIKKEGAV